MGKIAFLFAGQGSQYSGMGRELCEVSPAAKEVFEEADKIRPSTSNQCFSASKEELSQTVNTQPCLYCVELAAAEALRSSGIVPDAVAGFSLGEVAALTFAGGFSKEDGFRFVCRRGELMDTAANHIKSGMTAVLKLKNEAVENLCRQFIKMYPVNYNCPGQLVVAGSASSLPAFCAAVKQAGGKAVMLPVSGGFHSPFMDAAAQQLVLELSDYNLKLPRIPVYSNLSAMPYEGTDSELESLLSGQVTHPVLWEKTIRNMAEENIDTFIEVGPGKTLCGFLKKILPSSSVYHVEDTESLENTVQALTAF